MAKMAKGRRWHWWHGVVFYAGVRLAEWAACRAARHYARRRELGTEGDMDFYRRQRLPWFAPPPWAFPVAWGINSAGLIAGGVRALNLPRKAGGRPAFLALQAVGWVLFASFDAAYFELRSPRNAALVTVPYAAATWGALALAAGRLRDRRLAAYLAPAAAWCLLAAPLSVAQARLNGARPAECQ